MVCERKETQCDAHWAMTSEGVMQASKQCKARTCVSRPCNKGKQLAHVWKKGENAFNLYSDVGDFAASSVSLSSVAEEAAAAGAGAGAGPAASEGCCVSRWKPGDLCGGPYFEAGLPGGFSGTTSCSTPSCE
mmetsp:Transcript_32595/g.49168  ORF Transcript_32595/g.49168 Transcript_32595/m.49168 type:complete len:132 (-) Transcript_32595:499-894(-)